MFEMDYFEPWRAVNRDGRGDSSIG